MKLFSLILFMSFPLLTAETNSEQWTFNADWAKELKMNFEENRNSNAAIRNAPEKVVNIIRDNVVMFFAMDNRSRKAYMRRVLASCRRNHGMTRLEANKFMGIVNALNIGTNEDIAAALNAFAEVASSPAINSLVEQTGIGYVEIPPPGANDFGDTLGDVAIITAQIMAGVIGIGLTVAGTAVGIALDLAGFVLSEGIGITSMVISLAIEIVGVIVSSVVYGLKEGIKAAVKGVGKAIGKFGKAIGKLFKGKKGKKGKKGFMADENGNGDCCGIPITLSY